jgi:hypothetical protein
MRYHFGTSICLNLHNLKKLNDNYDTTIFDKIINEYIQKKKKNIRFGEFQKYKMV